MQVELVRLEAFSSMPDTQAKRDLLPEQYRSGDNALQIEQMKEALRGALSTQLTPIQSKYIQMHYWQGLSKSEIAKRCGVGCSTVSRTIAAAEESIRGYIVQYMDMFDRMFQQIYDSI